MGRETKKDEKLIRNGKKFVCVEVAVVTSLLYLLQNIGKMKINHHIVSI